MVAQIIKFFFHILPIFHSFLILLAWQERLRGKALALINLRSKLWPSRYVSAWPVPFPYGRHSPSQTVTFSPSLLVGLLREFPKENVIVDKYAYINQYVMRNKRTELSSPSTP